MSYHLYTGLWLSNLMINLATLAATVALKVVGEYDPVTVLMVFQGVMICVSIYCLMTGEKYFRKMRRRDWVS